LNDGESKELQKEILSINVQAFSHDEALLNEYLEKSPEWLKQKGDEVAQKDYLLKRVQISCLERFMFEFDEDFKPYVLKQKVELP
jgi:hypothetical protein